MDAGLKITVGADVSQAIVNIGKLDDSLETLEKDLARIEYAIDNALAAGRDTTALEADFEKVRVKIVALRAEAAKPIVVPPPAPIPAPDSTAFLNTISKQRIAFTDLGRVITGQGFSLRSLASNFALLGPGITIAAAAIYGLYELLNKQTDAEKKANEAAKQLKETLLNLKSGDQLISEGTGSEAGNIARVQALAKAVNDQTLTYSQQKNALDELRETNKSYFGEFTKNTATVEALSKATQEYGNALITEAIIKKQSEGIAELTSKLLDQVRAEDKLKVARDQAVAAAAEGPHESSEEAGSGGTAFSSDQLGLAASRATDAFEKQKDAVFKLREQIAIYKGDLQNAVNEQLKFKPLQIPPGYKDELKSIIPILEQIKKIYDELAKPNKEPLFKLFSDSVNVNDIKLIQAQIAEAIKKGATEGAKDPAVAKAYADLATALQAKLTHLQNPNLHSDVKGIVDVKAEDVGNIESKIEKVFGGAKGLQIRVPATFKLDLENSGYSKDEQRILLKQAEEDALKGLPVVRWRPEIQAIINKKIIAEAIQQQLDDTLNKALRATVISVGKDIGQLLGNALAGSANPLQAFIKTFLSTIGEGLKTVGQAMIEAGITIKSIKEAEKALGISPEVGIAVGIGAIALGTFLESKVSATSARAFATGGIVTGPTVGLIGEAGPEVVFPLAQLNRFVKNTQGSGTQNINITGSLSGNNIRLALARTNKLQGLV